MAVLIYQVAKSDAWQLPLPLRIARQREIASGLGQRDEKVIADAVRSYLNHYGIW